MRLATMPDSSATLDIMLIIDSSISGPLFLRLVVAYYTLFGSYSWTISVISLMNVEENKSCELLTGVFTCCLSSCSFCLRSMFFSMYRLS